MLKRWHPPLVTLVKIMNVSNRCEISCINFTDQVTGEDISNIGCVFDAGDVDLHASKVCRIPTFTQHTDACFCTNHKCVLLYTCR